MTHWGAICFCFGGAVQTWIKVIWHDSRGAYLFTKDSKEEDSSGLRLPVESSDDLSAQLSYLLSGIDWRNPQETLRPTRVG